MQFTDFFFVNCVKSSPNSFVFMLNKGHLLLHVADHKLRLLAKLPACAKVDRIALFKGGPRSNSCFPKRIWHSKVKGSNFTVAIWLLPRL